MPAMQSRFRYKGQRSAAVESNLVNNNSVKIFLSATLIVLVLFTLDAQATVKNSTPWEVLSEVRYMKRGGVNAVRIDFGLPVHYISHYPRSLGDTITINIRLNPGGSRDVSELPLLQTLLGRPSSTIPLEDVTFLNAEEQPKLVIRFKREVSFNVSQVMGITNLIIFLPDTDSGLDELAQPEFDEKGIDEDGKDQVPSDGLIPIEGVRPKRRLESGRRALRKGYNHQAIQIFAALLSQEDHTYDQEALELLGVSRERNKQLAHAKTIYNQYIKKFPDTEGATRVQQRLSDMLSSQLKPRKRLKKSKMASGGKRGDTSKLTASVSQSWHRVDTEDAFGRTTDTSSIGNDISLNWRIRRGSLDIKNYFFANYDYDNIDKISDDGVEVGSMYSRIKNRDKGYEISIGRQSASTAGVLGKFDGIAFGYDTGAKQRVNAVYGFLVDRNDKAHVQSKNPFIVFNYELNDYWKDLDINPFIGTQELDGITDRTAIGTEVRYFHKKGDVFSLVDYDILFNELNIFLLRGQYKFNDKMSINVNFDQRSSPLLTTENALVQVSSNEVTLKDLLDQGVTEAELRDTALDRTGESTFISVGLSRELSKNMQLLVDITSSSFTSRFPDSDELVALGVDPADSDIIALKSISDTDSESDFIVQLILSDWLAERDATILFLDYKDADKYEEWIFSAQYRRRFGLKWRVNTRFRFRNRESNDGRGLQRILPGISINYRAAQNLRLYFEFEIEDRKFKNDTVNDDYRVYDMYMGYTWDF